MKYLLIKEKLNSIGFEYYKTSSPYDIYINKRGIECGICLPCRLVKVDYKGKTIRKKLTQSPEKIVLEILKEINGK